MTAVERLAEIEARAAAARNALPDGTGPDLYALDQIVLHDIPVLVAALRAVLDLHAPNGMPVNRCGSDRLPYDLCPTVRAITDALDVTS